MRLFPLLFELGGFHSLNRVMLWCGLQRLTAVNQLLALARAHENLQVSRTRAHDNLQLLIFEFLGAAL